jgi:hypothetical protein
MCDKAGTPGTLLPAAIQGELEWPGLAERTDEAQKGSVISGLG